MPEASQRLAAAGDRPMTVSNLLAQMRWVGDGAAKKEITMEKSLPVGGNVGAAKDQRGTVHRRGSIPPLGDQPVALAGTLNSSIACLIAACSSRPIPRARADDAPKAVGNITPRREKKGAPPEVPGTSHRFLD
jgi:hypothetical protein